MMAGEVDSSVENMSAGLDGFGVEVDGSRLLGGFYRAAGKGPRPTAIFLHGLPGVEKNMDVAYALREVGWNVLYFHYRGSWGSGGNYNLLAHDEDLAAALAWVQQQPSVDADRLALVGSSMGGYNTLLLGARELRYKYLVSLCPLIDVEACPLSLPIFRDFTKMLNGVDADQLQEQWLALPSLHGEIEQLKDRHVLLITGDQDEIFPPEHYMDFAQALPDMPWLRKDNGDHQFSACRPWLRGTIVNFLNTCAEEA